MSESPADLQLPSAEELAYESATLFASLAFGRLAEETRDLAQARLAIDALTGLTALLPEERQKTLQPVIANLRLAYADAAKSA